MLKALLKEERASRLLVLASSARSYYARHALLLEMVNALQANFLSIHMGADSDFIVDSRSQKSRCRRGDREQ